MFNTLGIEAVIHGEGPISFRILFKKIFTLSEFRIDLSRFFHSIIAERKNEFLKKFCLK